MIANGLTTSLNRECYYDAMGLAQNGGGISSEFFNDGSSSVEVQVCFVAGTPVLLADGTSKPIEKILVGDLVLAVDHEHPDSDPQPCRVVRVFHNAPQPTWKLTLDDGQTIQCTKEHPFHVVGHGWTPAEMLKIGDHLRRPDGSTITLSTKEYIESEASVFNFEVENAHTYFVGNSHKNAVLVHNACMNWLSAVVGAAKTVMGAVKTGNALFIENGNADEKYATVYIWINIENSPGNPGAYSHDVLDQFNFDGVRNNILKIFENQPIKVIVNKTTASKPEQLARDHNIGLIYDRNLHIADYSWATLKGGPVGWVWGVVNTPWYYATRTPESVGFFVSFSLKSGNDVVAKAGKEYSPQFYPSSFKNKQLLKAGGVEHFGSVAYANIIVHECFYHCLLNEMDDRDAPDKHFTSPTASFSTLLEIPDEWMSKIKNKLRK